MGIKTRSQQMKTEESFPDTPTPQVVDKPEFLQKEAPRLGIILGGGGALSLAHVGVLQELELQKIPIHSMAGIEWGALVGGAYAVTKKAHAIEWKLLKVPSEKFENRSFFSSGKKSAKVSHFSNYLSEVFAAHDFSSLKIPFACPALNVLTEKQFIQNRGRMRNAVRNCWAYPPHFSVETVGANLAGVSEVAKYLRRNGAEVILYIDVVSKNKILSKKEKQASPLASLLWSQYKNAGFYGKGVVDEVIQISLPGYHINSYKSLRAIVRMGQMKSKSSIKGLAKKYAY